MVPDLADFKVWFFFVPAGRGGKSADEGVVDAVCDAEVAVYVGGAEV